MDRTRGEVPGNKGGLEFPELSPGHVTSGSSDTVTAPTGTQYVPHVAGSGLHINPGAVHVPGSSMYEDRCMGSCVTLLVPVSILRPPGMSGH